MLFFLTDQQVVVPWQTDGDHVVVEVDLLLHPDEGEVVLVGEEVVLGVHDLPGDLPLHVGQGLARRGKVPLPDPHANLRDLEAEIQRQLGLFHMFDIIFSVWQPRLKTSTVIIPSVPLRQHAS